MVTTTSTELLVIGGGTGGYVAAIRGAQLDLETTLVEMEDIGGTCLNRGCIPSKALITATSQAHDLGQASRMGIEADPTIDYQQLSRWKDRIVRRLTGGVKQLLKGNGVRTVDGRAEFVDQHSVRVIGDDGTTTERITFENAVVATGSVPTELPGFPFEADPIVDSRTVLAKESVPASMVIVGGGYISLETADFLAKAGCDVTVIGRPPKGLRGFEDDLVEPVLDRGRSIGIDYQFGMEAQEWWEHDDGTVTVAAEPVTETGSAIEVRTEEIMIAVGRRPLTETVNLDAAGVSTAEDGTISVDEQLATNVDNIYAIGDVTGEPMLAHRSSHQGLIAAEVAAGRDRTVDYRTVPSAVFTDPEIATAGLTEQEAEEVGYDPTVGTFPFRASGRALTQNDTDGFVRIVADSNGQVIGGQIVGPHASELIAEITLAIELEATLEEVAETVHTHPTLGESVMEAAMVGLDRPLHLLDRRR